MTEIRDFPLIGADLVLFEHQKTGGKLAPENSSPIDGVVTSFVYYYAVTGNPFHHSEGIEAQYAIDQENRDGLLKETAARWLADKELYTLTTTYPAPGEKEKQDEALKAKLAEIKAGMTQEELQAIVDATNAPSKEEDNTELMAKIQAVTVESLPEEIKTYTVNDFTDENGLRHIEVPAAVDGIGYVTLYLDAATLPQEDIHWMRLYTRLLGQLDTDRHTKEELDVLISRYLYAALHVLAFGAPAGTREDAVAAFAEYGLVPDGVEAATELTHGMSDQIFVIFSSAVGLPLEADAPDETTDLTMTRGELAEEIFALCSLIQ